MEELIEIMGDIRYLLMDLNNKVDVLLESTETNSENINDNLENINDNLENIKGVGLYNSISDVNDKLSEVSNELFHINLKID